MRADEVSPVWGEVWASFLDSCLAAYRFVADQLPDADEDPVGFELSVSKASIVHLVAEAKQTVPTTQNALAALADRFPYLISGREMRELIANALRKVSTPRLIQWKAPWVSREASREEVVRELVKREVQAELKQGVSHDASRARILSIIEGCSTSGERKLALKAEAMLLSIQDP